MPSPKEVIIGYNQYKNRNVSVTSNENYVLANVTYMYNYGYYDNDNYYWVDSYDNTTIDYLPPEPVNEGFTFAGWYKEVECINKWNFETDVTGSKLVIESKNQYGEYPGIYLFAKWIKNEN